MKRIKRNKFGGKSKKKRSTMNKIVVIRRKSKEKGVNIRARGLVDDVDLGDKVQKGKRKSNKHKG